MEHESTASPLVAIDIDGLLNGGGDAGAAYSKASFKLNLPYIGFGNSSIDDNPGTNTPTANGLIDGDYLGCINAGFKWTVTSDTSGRVQFHGQQRVDGALADDAAGDDAVRDDGILRLGLGRGRVEHGGWLSTGSNPYALVGGTELVKITSTAANTITFSTRGDVRDDGASARLGGDDHAARDEADRPQWRPLRDDDRRHDAAPDAGISSRPTAPRSTAPSPRSATARSQRPAPSPARMASSP